MQTNTLPELNRLGDLARKIRDTHETATMLADQTRKKGNEAITEALLCGQALNEAKELVPHGQWMGWLGEHCPKVSQQTANRYMKLANCSHVSNLDDTTSLRQLYLATGIITEPTKDQPCQIQKSQSESSSTESDSEKQSAQPCANPENLSDKSSESSDSAKAFQDSETHSATSGQPSSSEPTQPTFPNDRLGHLKNLVASLLAELDRLGTWEQLEEIETAISPVIQWANCRGVA